VGIENLNLHVTVMESAEHGRPARLETTPLQAHTAIEMASKYDTYVERLVKPIVTERRIRWINVEIDLVAYRRN